MVKIGCMTYDRKIVTLCESRGWDQSDLWRALGRVSKTTVSNWWNGQSRPDMDTALAVARVLGVELDYLADDALDAPPQPAEELTQDEELALKFYRRMRKHAGDPAPVLEFFAQLSSGVATPEDIPLTLGPQRAYRSQDTREAAAAANRKKGTG